MATLVRLSFGKLALGGSRFYIKGEILQWLPDQVGEGDEKFWELEDLERHLDHCRGGRTCTIMSHVCGSDHEVWGWVYDYRDEALVGFRDPQLAMLFKLTWA